MAVPQWWQEAVCYQVYPRSFADSNRDGIGDIGGVIGKLDYLQWLGVTALWVSPFYPSAQVDWGYDISDYTAVDPEYGTLEDVQQLIEAAHGRGIRVLLDLVLNHTSDQHAWFRASRSGLENPYRDWYIWREGKNGGPPNDWESIFGGSAWTLDPQTGQYYYHFFFPEQPDLNWRNPAVKEAIFAAMRFWLERGVDGFRLDAIGSLFEAKDLADSDTPGSLEAMFIKARRGVFEDWQTLQAKTRHQMNQPEIHATLREMRALADEYPDCVLLGETEDVSFYGRGHDELHSVFNFELIERLDAAHYRKVLTDRLPRVPEGAWESNTVGNHDRRRSYTFCGDGMHDDLRARLALAVTMFLRGTPVFYYGEEIGMRQRSPETLEAMRDTFGTRFYRILRERYGAGHPEALEVAAQYMGRDGCRTPMQWSNAPNAGFSVAGVETWLPVNPDHAEGVNVEDQREQPDSMLTFFRGLVVLRRTHPALSRGRMRVLADTGALLGFWREWEGERMLLVFNMSGRAQAFQLPPGLEAVYGPPPEGDVVLRLAPYGFFIGRPGRLEPSVVG
ncbi:MAG: alpha-glucosidase [Meiothermus sp.]|nr:alpha-glucosidase [Meiothermus sp.]